MSGELRATTIAHAGGKLIVSTIDGDRSYAVGAIFQYRGRSVPIKGGRIQTVKKKAEELKAGIDTDLDRLQKWQGTL